MYILVFASQSSFKKKKKKLSLIHKCDSISELVYYSKRYAKYVPKMCDTSKKYIVEWAGLVSK